jgi:hypothetical protein
VDLLTLLQQLDPEAHWERTAWGQDLLVTKAVPVPCVLLVNPEPGVIGEARRAALEVVCG